MPEPCLMRDVVEPAEDSVRIRWNSPKKNGSEILGYELQWRHWGGNTWKTAKNLISGTECRKKNLLAGKRYEFRVRAKNGIGYGPYAGSVSGVTTKNKPQENKTDTDEKVRSEQTKEKYKKKEKKKEQKAAKKAAKAEQKARAAAAANNARPAGTQRSRPRPNGPPPPESPKAAPPSMFNPAYAAPTSSAASAASTSSSCYPNVKLWYRMVDDTGHEYWWSDASGSVWDGPTWVDRWDDSHNAHYYEHRVNGHATWSKPTDFVPIIPGSS